MVERGKIRKNPIHAMTSDFDVFTRDNFHGGKPRAKQKEKRTKKMNARTNHYQI
jgi:hypothetical protein